VACYAFSKVNLFRKIVVGDQSIIHEHVLSTRHSTIKTEQKLRNDQLTSICQSQRVNIASSCSHLGKAIAGHKSSVNDNSPKSVYCAHAHVCWLLRSEEGALVSEYKPWDCSAKFPAGRHIFQRESWWQYVSLCRPVRPRHMHGLHLFQCQSLRGRLACPPATVTLPTAG
jgi:hypothetical protein